MRVTLVLILIVQNFAHTVPIGMSSLNKSLPDKLCREAGMTRKTSHSLKITSATMFQNSVEEKLISERTGHRSNALYKYEKPNLDQLRQVSEILGPPQSSSKNQRCDDEIVEVLEANEDLAGVEYEIPDEASRDIPIPGDVCVSTEMFTRSVFNKCTFNIVHK